MSSDPNANPQQPVGSQPQSSPTAPLEPSSHDDGEHLDPKNEQDLWQGRQSMKTLYPTLALWLLMAIAIIVACATLGGVSAALWGAGGSVILLLLLISRLLWRIAATSYRITTQRLFIRRGILTQSVDQTELLRVDDVKMTQTLLERMLGIGSVEVASNDRSDGFLTLRGIADPATVAEHIRRHTRMVQGKRTLFMESL